LKYLKILSKRSRDSAILSLRQCKKAIDLSGDRIILRRPECIKLNAFKGFGLESMSLYSFGGAHGSYLTLES
jgi:hypothetical protein